MFASARRPIRLYHFDQSAKLICAIFLCSIASHAWWDAACPVRIPITVSAGTAARPAKFAFEVPIDFREVLKQRADSMKYLLPYLRVLEANDSFNVVDSPITFQYDRDSTRASKGALTIANNRLLPSGQSRTYHLYLSRYKPVNTGPQVLVRLGRWRDGPSSDSLTIATQSARYVFNTHGAGFARMIDKDGNDWIGYNRSIVSSRGAWRGLPCLALEQFGHPGIPDPIKGLHITTELSTGPVKMSLRSTDEDKKWETVWTIYPLCATMEVTKAAAPYWFAYEGAPGGTFDSTDDYVVLPDSSTHSLGTLWAGDIPSRKKPYEWIGIGDRKLDRVLFMIHHTDDTFPDVARPLGEMAVVGFGRAGSVRNNFQTACLSGTGRRLTVGFADSKSFSDVSSLVTALAERPKIVIGKVQAIPDSLRPKMEKRAGKPEVRIIVSADSSHQFTGIGVNINSPEPYGGISEMTRKEIARRLYREANIHSIRLWSQGNVSRVKEQFFTNGLVTDALGAGVSTVMLTGLGHQGGKEHALLYAGMIDTLRREGYPVNAMSFLNKSNTNGSGTLRWDSVDVAKGVTLLHEELVKRGLADKIMLAAPGTVEWWPRPAPEHANKYDYQKDDDVHYLHAICRDPKALAALSALDLQSYGKGMTPEIQGIARRAGKPIWITLGATDPVEVEGSQEDPCVPSIRAAICLSDLNLGASRWFSWSWWQLCDLRLAAVNPGDSMAYSPTYFFLKNFSTQIDSGACMHACISDPPMPTKEMDFNYTQEPRVVAAAARNPDGSWVVGCVNLTGLHTQHYASYIEPGEGQTYRVTVDIKGLAATDKLDFTVSRTRGSEHRIITGERVHAVKGVLAIDVQPEELAVLKSVRR